MPQTTQPQVTQPQTWRKHIVETLKLGLPLVGIQLAQAAMGITDTVMVGWLGAPELAALVLATSFFFVLFIVGLGFAQAVLPLAASAKGTDDNILLRRTIRMGFWVTTGYAIVAIAILFNTQSILLAIGQKPQTAAFATQYMDIAKWALLPMLLFMNLRAFYTVLDRANIMLVVNIAGVFVNAALNYIFIFGNFGAPELGIQGAAIATLGVSIVTFAAMALYSVYDADMKTFEIYGRFWRADTEILKKIINVGAPISMTLLAEVGLFTAASIMVGWIGILELAAHGIALQLATVAFMVPLGLSNVATTRVGLAFGRGHTEDVKRAAYATFVVAAVFSTLAGVAFWLFPQTLISWFLDESGKDTAAVIALAIPYVLLAALFQLVDGSQAIAAGALRGMQDTRMPMVIAVFSYWIAGLGTSYLLAFTFELRGVGVWAGLAMGLTFAAIMLIARFMLRDRLRIGFSSAG